jgi:predicted RNA-binding Zn ribbon-like protein
MMDVVTRSDEDMLLELLNTTPVVDGNQVDELGDEAAGRRWSSRHGGHGTPGELPQVVAARALIQGVVRGDVEADALSPFVAHVSLRPALGDDGVTWTLDGDRDRLLAARAVLAWSSLQEGQPGRLRPCANPDCRRFLIDRSHGNRAQWCSMAVCGNRMKARRHYQRTRAES